MTNAISMISPVGDLTLTETEGRLSAVTWGTESYGEQTALLRETQNQLEAYFNGTLTVFDLPLQLSGSGFQKDVCRQMLKIPYGETWTYGEIAKNLKTSAQPVGGACGRNTIPIIIPCHRVMGAEDKLTGFSGAGGVGTKKALLTHEGWQPKEPDLFA